MPCFAAMFTYSAKTREKENIIKAQRSFFRRCLTEWSFVWLQFQIKVKFIVCLNWFDNPQSCRISRVRSFLLERKFLKQRRKKTIACALVFLYQFPVGQNPCYHVPALSITSRRNQKPVWVDDKRLTRTQMVCKVITCHTCMVLGRFVYLLIQKPHALSCKIQKALPLLAERLPTKKVGLATIISLTQCSLFKYPKFGNVPDV